MVQAGPGKIRLFNDMAGGHALTSTVDALPLGDFYTGGEGHEDADAGVAPANFLSGAVSITSGNTDADTTFIGTGIMFDVGLMGTIVLETRIQVPDLDTKEIFFGITSILTFDEQLQDIIINSSGTAVTLVAELAGFYMSDELTVDTQWHAPYTGGTAASAGATVADVNLGTADGATITAGEWQILRMEIDTNGTVRWLVNGVQKQRVVGAVSTTTNFAAVLALGANTTELAIAQCDYLLVKANRDWTV